MSKVPKVWSWWHFPNIIRERFCNCFSLLLWCKTLRYFTGFQSSSLLLVNFRSFAVSELEIFSGKRNWYVPQKEFFLKGRRSEYLSFCFGLLYIITPLCNTDVWIQAKSRVFINFIWAEFISDKCFFCFVLEMKYFSIIK